MRIGCHISVSKGFGPAVERAHALGAQCFQYFTKSPRMLRFNRKLNRPDAERGRQLQNDLGLVSLGHAPYLINLSAPEEDMRQASVDALLWDMVVAEARGTGAVVVHCGKHKGAGLQQGIARMQESLKRFFAEDATGLTLLLENTAGQGSELGFSVDQLLELVEGIEGPERLGFCLDTQHAYAAGILDLSQPDNFPGLKSPEFMARLKAIHLNDSKVPFNHHADRHALIGQGFMGQAGIAQLLSIPSWKTIPFYLETPVANEAEYAQEMDLCRRLAAS